MFSDGEAAMTFRKRLIIPVILYFISMIFGLVQSYNHRQAVINLINNAGSRGEPVIAAIVNIGTSPSLRGRELEIWLCTIDGNHVKLASGARNSRWVPMLQFSDDGTLLVRVYDQNWQTEDLREMALTSRTLHPVFRQPPQVPVTGESTIGTGRVANSFDEVRVLENHILVFGPEGEIILTHEFTNQTPWKDDPSLDFSEIPFILTSDLEKLVVANTASRRTDYTNSIWLYDIETDEWLDVIEPGIRSWSIDVDHSGMRLITEHEDFDGDQETTVISMKAGLHIFSMTNLSSLDIWANWAVAIDHNWPDQILKVYYIVEGWREIEIDLAGSGGSPITSRNSYAIYEPPPDGIEGMYGNPE